MTEITSVQHPMVKHLVKLRTNSDYREEKQSFCVEGLKMTQEATGIIHIFYTSSYAAQVAPLSGKKTEISEPVLHKISGMVSPEGVIAEVSIPAYKNLTSAKWMLVFDGVNDPGNMGALMRSALAFGWDSIYLLPQSCDPFNDKTIRAARGAHFHLSLLKGNARQLEEWIEENQAQSLVADLSGIAPEQIQAASKRVLILGNEARGPSQASKQFSQSVAIPMNNKMESLNVAIAGGILLYLFRKEQ